MASSSTLALLQSIFPGRAIISATEAGQSIGLAKQTVKNQICKGTFPIPTTKVGKKRCVRLIDLAAFIDGKNKVGRPRGTTKAALLSIREATNLLPPG